MQFGLTWAVATQHPWLDEGGWNWDLVKQAAVVWARFLPRSRYKHLNSTLKQQRQKNVIANQVSAYLVSIVAMQCHLAYKDENDTKKSYQTPKSDLCCHRAENCITAGFICKKQNTFATILLYHPQEATGGYCSKRNEEIVKKLFKL